MLTKEDYIRILSANKDTLRREYGVEKMEIFGSVARGSNDASSDIDVLVDMPPKIFLMSALKQYLERLLHTSVDLVRRHAHISPLFLSQISKDAIIIF